MSIDQHPNYLGEASHSGDAVALVEAPEEPTAPEPTTPGLTPPLHRGHSRGFTTDVLAELGYATPERVRQAMEDARTEGCPPEALLLKQGAITSDQLSRAIAERYGLDHVDLSAYQVDMAASVLFPLSTARRYKAIPVGFVDQQTLLVAAADPANVLAVDDIQIATGLDCQIAVAAEEDLEAFLGRLNTLQSATTEAIIQDQAREEDEEDALATASELQASAEDGPVIKLVYSVLGQAVGEGASDIHLEPEEGELRIRFRIDGVLKEAAHVPRRMISAVISRIKIMSELDIAEKRLPRTGGSASRSTIAASTFASPPSRPSVGRGRRFASSTRRTPRARSTSWAWTRSRAGASRGPSGVPMAPCSSPARPARASRRPSTRPSRT